MNRSRFNEEQIIAILKEQEAGMATAEVSYAPPVPSQVYDTIFAREYFLSNDLLIEIIQSEVATPAELPALRANLINEAAGSIGWNAGYLANSKQPSPADIDRLNTQAAALIKSAVRCSDELYYGMNVSALQVMVGEVCEIQTPTECAPVLAALRELTNSLPSQALDTARSLRWLNDGAGVGVFGYDPVQIANSIPESGYQIFLRHSVGGGLNGAASIEDALDSVESEAGAYLGRERLSYRWPKADGPLWLFASRENLDAFRAAPSKYLPQIGGYDLGALFSDKPALVHAAAFNAIRLDGELYYFSSGYDIDFSALDKKALDFAKDAYRKLSDPAFTGTVQKYEGEVPRLTLF